MLPKPDAEIHQISLLRAGAKSTPSSYSNNINPSFDSTGLRSPPFSFCIVRDDLLHPLANGNKARKLDAVLPVLQNHSVTDVVTCGGCQSAHIAATAVCCAERGIRSHLLLRGEQPEIPTGYNLVSLMYGNISYIPRSAYAKREDMLRIHADLIADMNGSVQLLDDILEKSSNVDWNSEESSPICRTQSEDKRRKVVIINEGAGGTTALLGVIRLVKHLSQTHLFGKEEPLKIVLDAGTGTTAIGLGLGVKCLGLPWKIVAVMLADTLEGYKKRERNLTSNFRTTYGLEYIEHSCSGCDNGVVQWVERLLPRKFGKVLEGEIEACQQIAQQTGILVDPMYTMAAWEQAVLLCQEDPENSKVVMLHTGGTLGLFGLAQRYTPHFHRKA